MNIKEKALEFAVMAHNGQVRKSEKEKPMVIHPINVANILEYYGFDDNVIAAGYLHDVVEDTKYELDDIEKEFNSDIRSLVDGASEPDKSLSWEERKQHTIDTIKNLDIRHKAVVCADKISNLEDLTLLFGKNSKYDFGAFKRGYDEQKWYYENVYESLIYNEDINNPMFVRLKEIIDGLFNIPSYDYARDIIFENNVDYYNKLKVIDCKVKEVKKLNSVMLNKKTYVIEFTGTPRTGKTTLINNLKDLFKKGNLEVSVLEEFTTSEKYKKEIYPHLKDKYKKVVNFEIPKYVEKQLEEELLKDLDIIIVDRSLFDRCIWVDRLYLKDGLTEKEYNLYMAEYIPEIDEKIDIVIATYTDSLTAIRRDYNSYLSLGKRNFLNEDNVNEYNTSLVRMKDKFSDKINIELFDTTKRSEQEVAVDVANKILDDIRSKYINELMNEYYKKID